ncbi:hypothetical protein PTTG_06058 [Puccinia triticina 1-1 BBBD Race 1]|uniref:m7GpppX diphosphatase n=2 Tax=Puccinia triticina TaxID=208348 RepID=A0A180G7E1_PUCT1|nr:uncharacterized protein PtA15_16A121 [Puccinia triticina]OAV88399.1 hypothetical protein PTTG_06058 [Puccinia triticina 1-1 BBBD Race 1]WAQ92215.1 hypothetical protein PtA15_16A121 [Puccinia triticina]WAR63959.1 hypothetical protein PtB15_16B118 [Puccinia triticina]
MEPDQPKSRVEELFRLFKFEKVLNEDPSHHTINLLGTIELTDDEQATRKARDEAEVPLTKTAIMIINKTHFSNQLEILENINSPDQIQDIKTIGQNDVYLWSLAWFNPHRKLIENSPDLKVSMIFPATEVHIRKYSKQINKIIRETPELYQQVVAPYIRNIPPTRLSWLYNILDHITESDKIVYEDPSETEGFMIIPDLKWDQTTLSSLYLLCIVRNRQIHSLRDLCPSHLGMLRAIRARASESIEKKFNVPARELRMFVHYQPSYYHFHVHITHVNHLGFQGITAGQAHLLDEIIDNLELELHQQSLQTSSPPPLSSFYQSKTLTYALGSNHPLFEGLWSRQEV